jgi:hypothetical protein
VEHILNAYEMELGRGVPLCKTSSNFVFATTHLEKNKVYLQRGYRNYGLTHKNTMDQMEIIEDKNLDFHMHKKRYRKRFIFIF